MNSVSACRLLVLIVLLAAGGCGHVSLSHGAAKTLTADEIAAVFGNSATLTAVESPDRVQAWRIESKGPLPAKVAFLDRWKRLSEPVAVAPDVARQLSQILADPSTYNFESAKGCKFNPGVQVRFVKGEHAVDVLFCFQCNELVVCDDGKRVGGEDIDHARPRLAALMKQIFPGDASILEL